MSVRSKTYKPRHVYSFNNDRNFVQGDAHNQTDRDSYGKFETYERGSSLDQTN